MLARLFSRLKPKPRLSYGVRSFCWRQL